MVSAGKDRNHIGIADQFLFIMYKRPSNVTRAQWKRIVAAREKEGADTAERVAADVIN